MEGDLRGVGGTEVVCVHPTSSDHTCEMNQSHMVQQMVVLSKSPSGINSIRCCRRDRVNVVVALFCSTHPVYQGGWIIPCACEQTPNGEWGAVRLTHPLSTACSTMS